MTKHGIERGRAAHALYAICLLLLAFPAAMHAQSLDLQVRPADREQLTQEPRQVVAVGFVVRNGTNRRVEVEPRLVLPEGWRPITPELPFNLAGNQSVVRLVSFMIPETARAGEYSVTYQVRDRLQPARSGEYAIRIRILPSPKLQVQSLETPNFAIAGAGYQTVFLVRNTGNSPISAAFSLHSMHGSDLNPRTGTLELEPGESKSIAVNIVTPELNRRADEMVTLRVEVPGTSIRESVSSAMQIVPRVQTGQAYRTLSSEFDLSLLAHDANDKQTVAWQAALSGFGTLDEANTRHLSYGLRGPDTRTRGSLGTTDEYWLNYWDPTKTALLGDGVYGLSWLTEPGRYGRGARLGYAQTAWGVSAYGMEDRFSTRDQEQLGFNTFYKPTSATRFDINLLDNNGGRFPGTVGSVRSQTQWQNGFNTDLEFGRSEGDGERGRAVRAGLYDNRSAFRYYFMGWLAEPEYRGYLRDEAYAIAGFDFSRRTGWGLRGYYRIQERNLDEDPTRPAPNEGQASLGVERTSTTGTRFSLDATVRAATDRLATRPVDLENHAVRVGIGQSFETLSLQYSLSVGKTDNLLSDTQFDTSQHLLSTYWRPRPSQSYGLYAFRDDNAYSNERQPVQTTVGANANYTLHGTTYLYLDAQRSDNRLRRYGNYTMSLLHTLNSGHRISLSARRLDGRLPLTEVLLAYRIPFDLPIFRKPNISTVRGRVFDAENDAGVPNVVLNLDGLTAVSNASGEYEFPAVQAGTYQLSIDRSNVDVSKVPLGNLPLAVTVAAKTPKQVDVALIRSIVVNLRVNYQGDRPGNTSVFGTRRANTTGGLESALVTLTSGDRAYRRVTDSGGRVRFAGLSPGRWSASIAEDAIPSDYEVESREIVLDVLPGGIATADFVLRPRARGMTILPPLRVN